MPSHMAAKSSSAVSGLENHCEQADPAPASSIPQIRLPRTAASCQNRPVPAHAQGAQLSLPRKQERPTHPNGEKLWYHANCHQGRPAALVTASILFEAATVSLQRTLPSVNPIIADGHREVNSLAAQAWPRQAHPPATGPRGSYHGRAFTNE